MRATSSRRCTSVASGREGFGCDNTDGATRRLDPSVVMLPDQVTDAGDPLAWLAFQGRWGQRESGFFNGPDRARSPRSAGRAGDVVRRACATRASSCPGRRSSGRLRRVRVLPRRSNSVRRCSRSASDRRSPTLGGALIVLIVSAVLAQPDAMVTGRDRRRCATTGRSVRSSAPRFASGATTRSRWRGSGWSTSPSPLPRH